VANPEWFHEPRPAAAIPNLSALAIEVWTMTGGVHFDNFFVGNSFPAAKTFANEGFGPKHRADLEASAERRRKKVDSLVKAARSSGGFVGHLAALQIQMDFFLAEHRHELALVVGGPVLVLVVFWFVGINLLTRDPCNGKEDDN
jgi:calnexin